MDGKHRRKEILQQLKKVEKPCSASYFAKLFGVSRQIIVGDVALLRASGYTIMATARGYLYQKENNDESEIITSIVCQHTSQQTEAELSLIISLGGEVLDVIIEHSVYGEMKGTLQLKTKNDVAAFMREYEKSNATLLSALTDGIHLHTIRCKNEETISEIKKALSEQGFLYENT